MATIEQLEKRVAQLEQMVLKIARGNVNTIGKVDDTSNRVTAITPYTETKTAYIGDTEVVFENAPEGNGSVFLSPDNKVYFWPERMGNNLCICFESPFEDVTEVTISIQ